MEGSAGRQPENVVAREYTPHQKGRAQGQPSVAAQDWKTGIVRSADFSRKGRDKIQNFI